MSWFGMQPLAARGSYGSTSTIAKCSRQSKAADGNTVTQSHDSSRKVGHVADVRAYRHDRRFAVPFCSQVTDKLRLNHLRILASAAAFAAILCNPCAAADAPKDITIRTGPQLKERLDQELKTKDGYSAIQYFEKKFGDKVSPEGLSEVQFRSADKDYSIFFIPFTTPAATSKDGQQEHPVVLSAKGPKGTIVHLGTVIA